MLDIKTSQEIQVKSAAKWRTKGMLQTALDSARFCPVLFACCFRPPKVDLTLIS